MSNDQDHHYVPRFYLRKWASQSDGKVNYFQWINGRFIGSRISPDSTAFERNLYSLENVPLEERQVIETFFSTKIDHPASLVLNKILQDSVDILSHDEKVIWVRFLISLLYRRPPWIERARQEGKELLGNLLAESQDDYEALLGPDDPLTFVEFCQANFPGILPNVGIEALRGWIYSTRGIHLILKMHWWVVDVSGEDIDLLTSNHPCIFTKGLGDSQCLISLPLSPNIVFFAANDPNNKRKILGCSKRKLIRRIHESMLNQKDVAMIYSTSDKQTRFLRNYFKNP